MSRDKVEARAVTWPCARVSADWFVNTSATSDAGESAGVSSGPSVFKVHEADASGRRTADVFRGRRHAGGRWQLAFPHRLRGRGYKKNCVLYPQTWVDEINFCRFRCVINDGPYTLTQNRRFFLHLLLKTSIKRHTRETLSVFFVITVSCHLHYLLNIIINVKINVALSENASRTRYTIKIKRKLGKWVLEQKSFQLSFERREWAGMSYKMSYNNYHLSDRSFCHDHKPFVLLLEDIGLDIGAPNFEIWDNLLIRYKTRGLEGRKLMLKQEAQLSQRDRAAGYISFVRKWKTGTQRQYFTDMVSLASTTVT